jgi:ferric-dicitrate binding protein FerR (iron transport regulator)
MKRKKITVESLAADERFQNYCLRPNAEDIQYWEKWQKENPDSEDLFAKAQELVLHLHSTISDGEVDNEWQKLAGSIKQKKGHPMKKVVYLNYLRYAAAILILLVLGVGLKVFLTPAPSMTIVQTDLGIMDSIILDDQTKVVLNANSSIEFSENWNTAKEREVWLKGEAWFDVTSNPDQPFIVHTAKGDIRVLGTVFNAMQRADHFDVVLEEGRIRLELEDDQAINVQPGEQVIINGNVIKKQEANLKSLTAWRHGKLMFKNSSVQQIVNRLQDEYGWEIRVQNKALLERKVNAAVPSTKPALLLKALEELYEFDIEEIQDGVYLIR